MGENNSKQSNRQRINLKNIQATLAAQFQKNKGPNQKVGQITKQTFPQRRHTDCQQTHEKISTLIIREMQIKITMRYRYMPVRMAAIQKSYKQYMLERVWRKGKAF